MQNPPQSDIRAYSLDLLFPFKILDTDIEF